jgi:hypothetical protein
VVNGGVELSTKGIGFWRKVEGGQIVLPDGNQAMEEMERDDEENEEEQDDAEEEGHGKVAISSCPSIMACAPLSITF